MGTHVQYGYISVRKKSLCSADRNRKSQVSFRNSPLVLTSDKLEDNLEVVVRRQLC